MKEGWCPICGMKTRSGKVNWVWFWVYLFFITTAFPFYLAYCLFTRRRICERCHNRIEYIPLDDKMEDRR